MHECASRLTHSYESPFMHVNEHLGLIKSLALGEAEITENRTDKYYIVSMNEMGPTVCGSS